MNQLFIGLEVHFIVAVSCHKIAIKLGVHLKCKESRGSENVRADPGRGEIMSRNCAIALARAVLL